MQTADGGSGLFLLHRRSFGMHKIQFWPLLRALSRDSENLNLLRQTFFDLGQGLRCLKFSGWIRPKFLVTLND